MAVLPEVVVSVELENGKKGHATREPSSPRQVPNTDAMQIDLIWRCFFTGSIIKDRCTFSPKRTTRAQYNMDPAFQINVKMDPTSKQYI